VDAPVRSLRSTHRSTRSHPFTSERTTREAVRKASADSRATASPYRYRTGVRVLKNVGGHPRTPKGATVHRCTMRPSRARKHRVGGADPSVTYPVPGCIYTIASKYFSSITGCSVSEWLYLTLYR
jgi:hypothetical protein